MDQRIGSVIATLRVDVSADTTAEILSAGERLAAVVRPDAVDLEVARRVYVATPAQKYAVLAVAISLSSSGS